MNKYEVTFNDDTPSQIVVADSYRRERIQRSPEPEDFIEIYVFYRNNKSYYQIPVLWCMGDPRIVR